MRMRYVWVTAVLVLSFAMATRIKGVQAQAGQDRYAVKALNGISFGEFRGYENWQDVAVSTTDTGIKVILANPVMMKAYREGVPGNGKPFPEGSASVKIEWTKKKNAMSPYPVEVPETLKSVSFIEKSAKRFPDSNGWGYAQFQYDAAAKSFKAFGQDAGYSTNFCHKCHLAAAKQDYIFTAYPMR